MRRIIPKLVVRNDGALLDSVQLPGLQDQNDPVQVAAAYAHDGAHELMLVAADLDPRAISDTVTRLAGSLPLPFAITADFSDLAQLEAIIDAGAARTVLGSAALADPDFISAAARAVGSEAVAVQALAEREGDHWRLCSAEGQPTEWDPVTWARVVEAQGGGELILHSIGEGIHGEPFDLELLKTVKASVSIPVIADGEAGAVEDLFDALMIGNVDGILVGALLHSGEWNLGSMKRFLAERGIVTMKGSNQ